MIPLKIPKIRFSEFDTEWAVESIRSYSTKVGSGSTPSGGSKVYQKEGVPFIRSQNVTDNQLDMTDTTFISNKIHDKMKGSQVKPFDILLNITGGSIGRSCVVPSDFKEGNVNQHVCIIRFIEQILPEFAQAYLSSFNGQKNIMRNQAGGGREGLNFESVKEIKLPYTNKDEQQKIADFLSSVDKKISLLKEKHALLEQYKKGVMQKLFSQETRFKDEKGNDFPDWIKGTLGDLSNKVSNKNKDESVTAVLTNSAKSGIVNQTDYFKKDIANENNLGGYSIVEKNDFVYNPRISVLAPVGPINRNHVGQGVMSPLYTIFRFKNEGLLDYLELYFGTTQWHRYMNSIANIGARHDRMNITMGDFFNLPIPIPSEDEMGKIVEFIQSLNKKVDLVGQQLKQTQTFKKGLLQQMFV
jgi:type I restriction enzyme S subunit